MLASSYPRRALQHSLSQHAVSKLQALFTPPQLPAMQSFSSAMRTYSPFLAWRK